MVLCQGQAFDWSPSWHGEKRQPHHGFGVSSVRVNIFRWLPCGWNHVCWKSVIEPSYFWEWCDGVTDSARDFDLLGESVPQVRVLARTLALLGFFSTCHLFWLPSFRIIYIYIYIYILKKIVWASSARMEKMPQLGLEPRSSSLRGWLLYRWAIEASARLVMSKIGRHFF